MRRFTGFLIAVAAVGAAALHLAGCGSGSGVGSPQPAPGPSGNPVTRDSAPSFSHDALALAVRVADGPWISADAAAQFDADLKRIRERYPQVKDIHAFGDASLTGALVVVKPGAPWRATWRGGSSVTTGEAALDALLTEFRAERAVFLADFNDGGEVYLLEFAQPLNIRALAPRLKSASPNIASAEVDGVVGDGNRITYESLPGGGGKKYVFSRGWGDCLAGCINRHYWEFTIAPSGSITMQERGDDLSSAQAQQ